MKSTVLLTIAIFLASAPAPDSESIAELSGGFLFAPDTKALQAAETEPGKTPAAEERNVPEKAGAAAAAGGTEARADRQSPRNG